jgi:hypothetical protein
MSFGAAKAASAGRLRKAWENNEIFSPILLALTSQYVVV